MACGILIPQPGIEHTSPALQDRFLTTGPPPGKLPSFPSSKEESSSFVCACVYLIAAHSQVYIIFQMLHPTAMVNFMC